MNKITIVIKEKKKETFDKLVNDLVDDLQNVKDDLNTLSKRINKMKIVYSHLYSKKKVKEKTKKVCGFTKKRKISEELRLFLSLSDNMQSQSDITKMVNDYIKDHNLRDTKDLRNINPDIALQSILNIPKGVQLSYFNLQHYLKSHFIGVLAPCAAKKDKI